MGEKIKTFSAGQGAGRGANLVVSAFIIGAGLALAFLPPVQRGFGRFVGGSNYYIYYLTFIFAGLWLLVSTLKTKILKTACAHTGGLALNYKNSSLALPFCDIAYVVNYNRRQQQYSQIYLKGKKAPLQISGGQLLHFAQFAQWLEKAHCAFVLQPPLQQNAASFAINKQTKIEDGRLFYKGNLIEYAAIGSFSFAKFGERFYSGHAISLFLTDGNVLSFLTETTQNLLPFIEILRLHVAEKQINPKEGF